MRMSLAFAFVLFALPIMAQAQNYSSLIENRDIQITNDLTPAVAANHVIYNVDYNKNPKVIDDKAKDSRYQMRVETAPDNKGYYVDEIGQLGNKSPTVDITKQGIRTTHLDTSKKLVSYTNCSGEHHDYTWVQKRAVSQCVTITPEFCRNLNKSTGGRTFELLRAQAKACSMIANELRDTIGKMLDKKFKDEENTNLQRIETLMKDMAPSTPWKYGSAAMMSKDGLQGKKDEQTSSKRLDNDNAEEAYATFEHLALMAQHCRDKDEFFPEPDPAPNSSMQRPTGSGSGSGSQQPVTRPGQQTE